MHLQYLLPIARTSDKKIEMPGTCLDFEIISDIFELDRRMTLRKRAFPKYWPRSRAGDESAGTAVGTVPIYTPTSPRSYITRKTTPVWRITSNYLSWFTLAPAYRSEWEKTRIESGCPREKVLSERNRNLQLTLSARHLLPFSLRQKWVVRLIAGK